MTEQEFSFENRLDLSSVLSLSEKIRAMIKQSVKGQDEAIDMLIAALLADGHVLIEGVPGIGKTLTARLLSSGIDASFHRIQFTPDLMPADLLGTMIFNSSTREFEYRKGPVFGHIILVDEINRAPAKTQSALFEAMEERQVSMEGTTYPLPEPFLVVATQNPVEYEGTYRLPEAQLDRFMFKINMGYPEADAEIDMLKEQPGMQYQLGKATPVAHVGEITAARKLVQQVVFSDKLMAYLVNLMQKTRHSPAIMLGGSPRASINAMLAAKAYAAMQGRDFVTPEDLRYVLPAVLRHRILLTSEKEMEGISIDDVVLQIINAIEVPR